MQATIRASEFFTLQEKYLQATTYAIVNNCSFIVAQQRLFGTVYFDCE